MWLARIATSLGFGNPWGICDIQPLINLQKNMDFKNRLIETYEKYAQYRNKTKTHNFKKMERLEFLNYIKKEEKKTILEIGCGPGHDSSYFKKNNYDIFAIDISTAMVQLCKQKGIRAEVLDCYKLDLIEETFDGIYSVNCLLHIPKKDFKFILGRIAQKLNENGLFYLGLWGSEDFEGILESDKYEPKRFFSFHSAEELLTAVQDFFILEYYRRIKPWESAIYNSLILRRK